MQKVDMNHIYSILERTLKEVCTICREIYELRKTIVMLKQTVSELQADVKALEAKTTCIDVEEESVKETNPPSLQDDVTVPIPISKKGYVLI
uniref:Uncharacterized protein n=1 Tax=viral metagenome TaxID=1070528 RepID=A0A6C0CPL4_9ZZZZ